MHDIATAAGPRGPLRRVHTFEHDFARRQAHRVLPAPGGFAVRNDTYPTSHEHNRLIVATSADLAADPTPAGAARPAPDAGPVTARAVLAAAEAALGDLPYRAVSVDGVPPADWATAFVAAGYAVSDELVMVFTGPAPAETDLVTEVDAAALRTAVIDGWRRSLPGLSGQVHAQLADRRLLRQASAVPGSGDRVDFLAVLGPDGAPRAWCDLYLAAGTRVAQVEEVLTVPVWRGRGYAKALVGEAVRRAGQAGCELVFLRADAEDWPQEMYRRLGFEPVGHAHGYTRMPAGPAHPADRLS